MSDTKIVIDVAAEDSAAASRLALDLADTLKEVEGVLEADRTKSRDDTMDLGHTVEIVIQSGAMLALARGVATWLGHRKKASLTVRTHDKTGSVELTAEDIGADGLERIVEQLIKRT